MKRTHLIAFLAFVAAFIPAIVSAAFTPTPQMKTSLVFIVNFNANGDFTGWGSGFFVDEGIVVTNKHVIEGGHHYRLYATGTDDVVNTQCFKDIQKSDVRVNLNDDVAYMRVFLDCAHGTMTFADDPWQGDPVSVLGFPYKGSLAASMRVTVTSGSVIGRTEDGWLGTDAFLDVGNSGGPVVNETDVLGVSVAKAVDADGRYLSGYFIPSSVILQGLLYASDSGFHYTPQVRSSSSRAPRSSSSSSSVMQSSASSSRSSHSSSSAIRSSSSSRSSASSSRQSSRARAFSDVPPSHPAADAIASLALRGVISGYADGTFKPRASINRAEFLKILLTGFKSNELRTETRCFRDVSSEWFAPSVCAAKRLGWIDGYSDPSSGSGQAPFFKPAQTINRAEAMKILTVAFGAPRASTKTLPRDVPADFWFATFVARGIAIGIVDPQKTFSPADDLTRGDAAIWIDRATKE